MKATGEAARQVAGIGFRDQAGLASILDALARLGVAEGTPLALPQRKRSHPQTGALAAALAARGHPLLWIDDATLAATCTPTQSPIALRHYRTGSVAEAAALAAARIRHGEARLLGPRLLSADRLATAALAEGAVPGVGADPAEEAALAAGSVSAEEAASPGGVARSAGSLRAEATAPAVAHAHHGRGRTSAPPLLFSERPGTAAPVEVRGPSARSIPSERHAPDAARARRGGRQPAPRPLRLDRVVTAVPAARAAPAEEATPADTPAQAKETP